jgi:uncharacterized protein (DUF1697 family)
MARPEPVRYAAFLRGINLGQHNRIAMRDLTALLTELGYTDITTILQSGNAAFAVPGKHTTASIAGHIAGTISDRLGLDVPVQVRTGAELASIVAGNPIREAEAEPARLNVVFLDAPVSSLGPVRPDEFPHEDIRLGDRVLYVWYHQGVGVSKLTPVVLERRLKVGTTTRNWNTVTKLADLTR